MRNTFSVFTILLLSCSLMAQGAFDNDELLGVIQSDELTFDVNVHTNGWIGVGFNRAKIKTYYKTNYYRIEIDALKHSRESRNRDLGVPTPGYSGKSYVFGRKNSFFLARGGFGQKRYFSEKQERRGVAIGVSYSAGATLGILKPYYLDLRVNDGDGNTFLLRTKYDEKIADAFLDAQNIIGASGFRHGWREISVVPGLQAKAAVHVDWGATDEFVKALEFGFMIDAFYKKIDLMVTEENTPVFINVYLALHLGRRW